MTTPKLFDVIGYQMDMLDKLMMLEEQNAEMLDVLKWLDSAIMPDERKYDQYGWCKVHRDTLGLFETKVKQAIAKVEGKE